MSQPPPSICDYEGSDYQQRFWEHGGREYEDRVEAIALRRLLPPGGGRLLEVGAGAGRNSPRYAGYEQVVLLDYSRWQLRQAQARLGPSGRYRYVVADAYRLPFAPGTFQAATMIRTFHHMADPLLALRQVRRVLGRGAPFVLEFANKRNLKAIARWLLRRQEWNPFDKAAVEFAALNFDFHPAAVRAWLTEAGFVIRRQLTVSHFRVGLLKRRLPLQLLVAFDSLAQWTGNLWQLSPSVFLLARAAGGDGASGMGTLWRCPACGSLDLVSSPAGVDCRGCGRRWPLKDGIYDFRLEPPGKSPAA
ncbi:MAG: class I SAM-dependent methyltransferase [Chloroflexota bacterium]